MARGDSDTTDPSEKSKPKKKKKKREKRRPLRTAIAKLLSRSSFLRRRYVRRILRSIDKSKAKGKRLPTELFELSQQLSRVPREKRAEALEQAIKAGPEAEANTSRALRRAAAGQQRMSGRGGNRYRPGTPPPPPGQRRGRPR